MLDLSSNLKPTNIIELEHTRLFVYHISLNNSDHSCSELLVTRGWVFWFLQVKVKFSFGYISIQSWCIPIPFDVILKMKQTSSDVKK